jgi:alkanesulfonate monooxygenase SsuD/methylene tetrahydromethanopterin reductase-like flavin-dependent oxidoreductase (luciferase family)
MDECMEIVRGLTSGGYYEFHGEFYDIPAIKISPVPSQPIPLLVGGHADAALRRAVLRGDGWMHGGGAPEELDLLLSKIDKIRRAEGLENKPFEIHVISLDAYTPDGVKRLADRGVTDVIVGFRVPYVVGPDTEPLAKKVEHLNRYAEQVIARVG